MANKPYIYREQWPVIAGRLNRIQIKPEKFDMFKKIAEKHIRHKDRYIATAVRINPEFPWTMIAVLHERESSGNFETHLHNGDSLQAKTHHVPAGRPPGDPPFTWEESAFDALTMPGKEYNKIVPPWPIEKIIFHDESYNGLGYFWRNIPSPYIWAGTNIQVPGKFVADGVWDPHEVDQQPGCAGMLWMLGHLDTSIKYTRET